VLQGFIAPLEPLLIAGDELNETRSTYESTTCGFMRWSSSIQFSASNNISSRPRSHPSQCNL